MSRRTLFALIVPLLLIAAYFGVTSYVRAHVTDLIQHAVDKPLPEFRLADREGKVWTNADLLGKRAVLHFFRSHCHSCELEAPAIRALEQRQPGEVVWLHVMTDVMMDVEPEVTEATIARKQFTAPILMADEAFMERFHKAQWSKVTPVTYVVDPKGIVRYGLRGKQTEEAIAAAIAAAVER
ncbi:MAG: TlpA family protein disulfide reductase [Planctomycetes bacterium]|nr:TlpA family protein disulfide reductase [Planctomycetota bacterium]